MPLRTAKIGARNLRRNPRTRAEWNKLRESGAISSVFASNFTVVTTSVLDAAIFRAMGKPGRMYEKTNRDLRELRLATPQCIEAMLGVHPIAVAEAKGATRDIRVVRWNSGRESGIIVPSDILTPPTKKSYCESACQTTVTDDMMIVVRDHVEEVMK